MALGKAFIEVHADTKPFARELAAELSKIVDAVEPTIKTKSRKLGETISKETGEGVKKNRGKLKKDVDGTLDNIFGSDTFSRFAKGIVDTIDDGISGLPAELKVVIGAAIVALAPVAFALGSALAAAVTVGLLAGLSGAFVAVIGSQFAEVQDAFQGLISTIRSDFLESVRFSVGGIIDALLQVRERFKALLPDLQAIFQNSVRLAKPLVDIFFNLAEAALPGLNSAIGSLGPSLDALSEGAVLIGRAIGDFFKTIVANDDTDDVIYDIAVSLTQLIQVLTFVIDKGIDLYGVFLDIGQALGIFAEREQEIKHAALTWDKAGSSADVFAGKIEGTTVALDAENKAIDELNKSIDLLTKLTTAQISNEITFEQGIDDLTDSLKKNKDTLNLHEQAGRDNANQLLRLAQTIIQTRDDTIQLTGDTAAAEAAFNSQRDEVYRLARQMGLSKKEVDGIIGSLLAIPAPKQSGVTSASLNRLEDFNQALQETIRLQQLFDPNFNPRGPGGQQKYADGGIVTGPTNALIGEAGAEAVIPLTKPARAAEIMSQAGLTGMTGPNVNVYIGNEQIQAYIAVETNRQLSAASRAMSYGTRGI